MTLSLLTPGPPTTLGACSSIAPTSRRTSEGRRSTAHQARGHGESQRTREGLGRCLWAALTTATHPALTLERQHAKLAPTLTACLHSPQLVATTWQLGLMCEANEGSEYDKQRHGTTRL